MKSRSVLSCVFAIVLILSLILGMGCAEKEITHVDVPNSDQNNEATLSPTGDDNEAQPTQTEFTSSSDDNIDPDTPLFDKYTAELLIPALAACMESSMLSYPVSSEFPVIPVTDDAAYTLLYAYAQANFYVDGTGASMSEYEITELLRLVYGDEYTYADFERAAESNAIDVTVSGDTWNFGVGECYPPTLTYASNEDLPLNEETAYYYNYTAAFDDEQSGQIAVYVQADDSVYSVRIVKIELVEPAE